MTEKLITIFKRDLNKLKNEIAVFQSEENIWKTAGGTSNSAGNLALHITGNLNIISDMYWDISVTKEIEVPSSQTGMFLPMN